MKTNQAVKTERKTKPFQIWWDVVTKEKFKKLISVYDPRMPVSVAVVKLIDHAIEDNWLPGYIRKERVISNKLANAVDGIGKEDLTDGH